MPPKLSSDSCGNVASPILMYGNSLVLHALPRHRRRLDV